MVRADVYLLTDIRPAFLPRALGGLILRHSAPASPQLMRDLRTDKGMSWMPAGGMWLTHLAINSAAGDLTYDLAVDVSGRGRPSRVAARLEPAGSPFFPAMPGSGLLGVPLITLGVVLSSAGAALLARRRPV